MSARLDIVQVPMDRLEQHPDNPRSGDVDAIARSIEVNGFYQPIIVQRSTGYILAGNHRFIAGLQIGMTTFPVVYADVDELGAKRIMVADNQTAKLGWDDEGILADLLEELHSTDTGLDGSGFDQTAYAALQQLVDEPLDLANMLPPEMTPEQQAHAKRMRFHLSPVMDEDGKVRTVTVKKFGDRPVTARDFDRMSQALGHDPITFDDLTAYGIPSWKLS